NTGRHDWPVPRMVWLNRMRRSREDIDEVVVQYPVLLGLEGEVVDSGKDLVRTTEVGQLDDVREVVVRLVADHQIGMLGRVRRELPANELKVVGARAERVGDATVPARESRAR